MNKNIKIQKVHPLKKSDIETLSKRATDVERDLHSLEHIWKTPKKIKHIDKWQNAIEDNIDELTKILIKSNYVIKNNVDSIKEIKEILDHNNENIKTIFDILKYLFQKDTKDKGVIYNTLKKRVSTKYKI